MIARLHAIAAGVALIAAAQPASAESLSARDSFRIGSSGVLCTAQFRTVDAGLQGMFDRAYTIVCRDAAAPVGTLYALRKGDRDPQTALAQKRLADMECGAATPDEVPAVGGVMLTQCQLNEGKIPWKAYAIERGRTIYVAEGLAGYDSALRLGLQAILADRPVEGEVQVATTAAGDPAAFARVQAGQLDADRALAEAYTRNNSGSYAEAAEFFETLATREDNGRTGEYLINQALQQSNLGNFVAADSLFDNAAPRAAADPVLARMLRNFRAIHLLNQGRPADALTALNTRVMVAEREARGREELQQGVITAAVADRINRENDGLGQLGGVDNRLTPSERAQILDAQAMQLRGAAQRLAKDYPAARASLDSSIAMLGAVRGGRVVSTAWLRSEVASELGLIAEATGDQAGADRYFRESVRIFEVEHPQSAALLASRARLAAYYARQGRGDEALALYRGVVGESERIPGATAAMRGLLPPYFALLAERAGTDPAAVADMFMASQTLLRPGVAQTQAVLARELSSGDDAASGLFRQSLALSRDISRTLGGIARVSAMADPLPEDLQALAAARMQLEQYQRDQTALLAQLSQYPRYRVLAPDALTLKDLQAALKPGEGYFKVAMVGNDAYALFATRDVARGYKVPANAQQIERLVRIIRDSIVVVEDGQVATYPFDVVTAHGLYQSLFGPVDAELRATTHLIYEPDGPLLQLPANLLIMDQAGVDSYQRRIAQPGADEFDYRGLAWLGRDRDVSTSVAPRAFADVRAIAPSAGTQGYLGLGQNAPAALTPIAYPPVTTRGLGESAGSDDCYWDLSAWSNPIKPTELFLAQGIIGNDRSSVITGTAFTDTAITAKGDFSDYRIVHFATHGLVTGPRPECPARPALMTSFGGSGSDGLLSFREIYDLRLDADVVILSACDTAGMATVAATREAGISTGGNFALDGLVRAFVGAGARTVVASHWPVPDDYDATKRLISGLFTAPPGTPIATALRKAEVALMDEAETSHPYYWSGFAVVGDGERAMLRQ